MRMVRGDGAPGNGKSYLASFIAAVSLIALFALHALPHLHVRRWHNAPEPKMEKENANRKETFASDGSAFSVS